MLSKSRRIPRKLFKPLLESRRFINSNHFSIRIASAESLKVAVSVSKKVSKKAVVRNRLRRRVYSAVSPLITNIPNNLLLIIVKPGADKEKKEVLINELVALLKKV